ncbi:hypothetical protein YIM_33820 [Amycolatopsis sp. YIM 10]|nr:hypothetical protein YIM_33820 [Amycolatopsis sp. YIM 10]
MRMPFGPDLELPPGLRAVLLPDATARSQIELEAGILDAATQAIHHLHRHPDGRLTRPVVVIRSVTPLRNRLQLHLNPVAVAPLLYELMPFGFDGEVSGICGLRARQQRRSTELFLIDVPTARVELPGVGRAAWCAAAAYREVRDRELGTGEYLASVAPDRLAAAEERVLAAYGRVFGPTRIASGFLRRIALLRQALWTQTWTTGCTDLNVEWPGDDPRHAHVALALADPLFGIPGAEIRTSTTLHFPAARSACKHDTLCGPDRLALRSSSLPTGDGTASFRKGARPEWEAWRQALAGRGHQH